MWNSIVSVPGHFAFLSTLKTVRDFTRILHLISSLPIEQFSLLWTADIVCRNVFVLIPVFLSSVLINLSHIRADVLKYSFKLFWGTGVNDIH